MTMTRRDVFDVAVTAAATVGSTLIAGRPASSASQITKDLAQYREQPNGGQQCSQCTNYLAPIGCRIVSGPVAPTGWCKLFQAKSS